MGAGVTGEGCYASVKRGGIADARRIRSNGQGSPSSAGCGRPHHGLRLLHRRLRLPGVHLAGRAGGRPPSPRERAGPGLSHPPAPGMDQPQPAQHGNHRRETSPRRGPARPQRHRGQPGRQSQHPRRHPGPEGPQPGRAHQGQAQDAPSPGERGSDACVLGRRLRDNGPCFPPRTGQLR